MMRCIIVDDELLVRELLEDNVSRIPFLQLLKSCKGSAEAIGVLQNEKVDLIFLDIQMPAVSGLQLLQSVDQPPMVIIITAYEQYALQGFELNVVDYLLKPFSLERFMKACSRAHDLFMLKNKSLGELPVPDHFFVHVEYQLVKIITADIEYIEGLKDYIKIFLHGVPRPVLTRMSMKAIEEKLPEGVLARTHKSFLVAVSKVTAIKRDFLVIGTKQIPLSAHYREQVLKLLRQN